MPDLGSSTITVFGWVPGEAEPPFDKAAISKGMGTVTAQLHQHAATTHLPSDFARPTWDPADVWTAATPSPIPTARSSATAPPSYEPSPTGSTPTGLSPTAITA
ncbi:hypothetical protein [Streptomyces sp. NPDC057939]|uniref:hypothetical protein n=1 Tax=Streptomyces sp. NPDC057939 TaxID=3346284 RepID=UPI0036E07D59